MLKYAKQLKQKSSVVGVSHEHRPNSQATLMGVEVALNSLGHRNGELTIPKPTDERRIHFLGSSITLGWGVPEEEGFVALVQQLLEAETAPETGLRYTTVNAGVGNYNTIYEVETFKQQVELTDPDMVIIQYFVNDAEPNPSGRDSVILKHSLFAAVVYQHVKT